MADVSNAPANMASRRLLALVLLLGVVLVFGQMLSFEFLSFDDPQHVTENHHVRHGLSLATAHWAFVTTDMSCGTHSRGSPTCWTSTSGASTPAAIISSNLVLHGGSTVLLFLALDRLTHARWRSFVVALLFALHPLRADSVAWVAERKDTLCTFFTIATLLLYVAYTETLSLRRHALVVVTFVLGLLAKPTIIVFPAALFAARRLAARAVARRKPSPALAREAPALARRRGSQRSSRSMGPPPCALAVSASSSPREHGGLVRTADWAHRLSAPPLDLTRTRMPAARS